MGVWSDTMPSHTPRRVSGTQQLRLVAVIALAGGRRSLEGVEVGVGYGAGRDGSMPGLRAARTPAVLDTRACDVRSPAPPAIGPRMQLIEPPVPPDQRSREVLLRITARRAHILRELADGYSGQETALRIGLAFNGFRSHVQQLKEITGCTSVRELGRWWREHREEWLLVMGREAGVLAAAEEHEREGPEHGPPAEPE